MTNPNPSPIVLDPTLYDRARDAYERGTPVWSIGASFGVSRDTVYSWASHYHWRRPALLSEATRAAIWRDIEAGDGVYVIAARYGVAASTVTRWRKRGGIPAQPQVRTARRPTPPSAPPPPPPITFSYQGAVPGSPPGPPSLPPTDLAGYWCPCGHRAATRAALDAHKAAGKHLTIDPGSLL